MALPPNTRLVHGTVVLLLILVAAKALSSLYHIVTTTAPDFGYYYQAATDPSLVSSRTVHLLPPFSLLVYAPLRWFPYSVAQGIWVLGSFVSLLGVVWILARRLHIRLFPTFFLMAALSFLSFPARFTLGMGQVNLIALFLLVVAAYPAAAHPWAAGGLFALAALLKPELFLLAPIFGIAKRWREAGGLVLVVAGAVTASLLLFGADSYALYAGRLGSIGAGWEEIGTYYNQGLSGTVSRAGGGSYTYIVLACVLTSIALRRHVFCRIPFPDMLWRLLPTFILIEPIAWQHHFVFLLSTYVYMWTRNMTATARILLVLSFVLVSWNFSSPQFLDTIPVGWLISSHGTAGALLLWALTL